MTRRTAETPWWHPRMLRTAGSVTEAVYGLILATSVITVSRSYDDSNAGVVAVTVLVTGIVFWIAHVYSRALAESMEHQRRITGPELREVIRHDWPLVEITVPLVLILALGAFGVLADETAILVAMLTALVQLAIGGGYAARMSGAGVPGAALSAAVAVALGGAVVLLKVLVH